MKIKKFFKILVCLLLANIQTVTALEKPRESMNSYFINMKRDLLCLILAYPEYIVNIEKVNTDKVYLILKSGKKLIYDDKIVRNEEEKLNNGDLQDMMEQIYPMNRIDSVQPKSFNPGRIRAYPLFSEVYGNSQAQIEKQIEYVGNNGFSKNNGASLALKSVFKEINEVSKNTNIAAYVYPTCGAYNYRYVRGAGRLSAHAFGIAIDLKTNSADYWKWSKPETATKRISKYPQELIDIFERNNFIWGGKWGYFDIMHFEYRPEIILKGKYFGKGFNGDDTWYKGIDEKDDKIMNLIKLIDDKLQ